MNKQTLIVGCGSLGKRLLPLEKANSPIAICKSQQSVSALKQQGVDASAVNLSQKQNPPCFNQAHIYYFVPPPSTGINDTSITNFLLAINSTQVKKIVLISTTGVYGNCNGAWINESQALNPTADRAKRRVDAEKQLTQFCQQHQIDYVILRVPGIYGPKKLPIARLKKQQPILSITESPFSNRIHIQDLANIAYKAMHTPLAQNIYNVADNLPLSMSEYFIAVATALKLPQPPQISLAEAKKQLSANMLSYLVESKRINNQALLNDLNYTLQYPTLQHGLTAL